MSASLATNHVFGGVALRADFASPGDTNRIISAENRRTVSTPLRLGPWLLEGLLQEGMLTRVYQARPAERAGAVNLPPQYVVKVLREVWHDHPVALSRIRKEAIVGRCVAHRHVAPVLSVHVHRSPYYVVLPWLAGTNVAALLAARGQMVTLLALWIARQAAQALEALHLAGYVHGDIKPGNLMLASDGHVTLLDLSCAQRLDDAADLFHLTTKELPLLGTPKYLAPEAFIGNGLDPRADLFSLGLTLYEMLAGRLPAMPNDLPDLVAFKRGGTMSSLRAFSPQTPLDVAELVRSLTARDPLRRPSTAREVVQHLMRLEIATLRQRVPI